jgi:hypothetical protein
MADAFSKPWQDPAAGHASLSAQHALADDALADGPLDNFNTRNCSAAGGPRQGENHGY